MLKNVTIILLIILAVLLIVSMIFVFVPQKDVKSERSYVKSDQLDIIEAEFNAERFYPAISKYPVLKNEEKEEIYGLIVPHHDLAGDLIAQAMQQVSVSREIDRIVVVGPNHTDVGFGPAISAKADFQAQNGVVSVDSDLLDQLNQKAFVVYDKANFEIEHSIKVLIPFIKHYFPEAKVIPVIFTSKFDQEELLGQELANSIDNKTLIIASIDFSHYLNLVEAERSCQT